VVEIAVFLGLAAVFFGLAPTLICNWQRPAVSFALAEYHASGSGIQFNLTFLLAIAVVFGLIGLWVKATSKRRFNKV